MKNRKPIITATDGRRQFAGFSAAVLGYVVNKNEEILMLSHPERPGSWEVINGALEAGETVLEGVLRETAEEAGPKVRVRPLGTAHITSFHYDPNVRYMLSISYLLAYQNGAVEPGDDMRGSGFRWWKLEELMEESVDVLVPPDQKWVLRRAVELYRRWKDQEVDLQPELS